MKKIFVLGLALVLLLALAACGDKPDPAPSGSNPPAVSQPTDPGASQQQPSATPDESTPSESDTPDDVITLESFLSVYGLTEADITPEHFIEFGELKMDGNKLPGEIGSTGYFTITVDKEKTQKEQIDAWFEQLYTKMQSLSTDGKIHDPYNINTQYDVEYPLEEMFALPTWEAFPGTMWAYPYQADNGKIFVNVSARYDADTGEYKAGFTVKTFRD